MQATRLAIRMFIGIAWAVSIVPVFSQGLPDPTAELRYCGPPVRDESGKIVRSKEVLAAFKRIHPCPANGNTSGACPGWAIDHVIPLACGGCDAVINLQWLPDGLKNLSGDLPKDRWERKVYGDRSVYDAPNCRNAAEQ